MIIEAIKLIAFTAVFMALGLLCCAIWGGDIDVGHIRNIIY